MKALAQAIAMLAYAGLTVIQLFATLAGLHHVLGWSSFLSSAVAIVTAWMPVIGTAAGIWGAKAAWGWHWQPTLTLFLGLPVVLVIAMIAATTVDCVQAPRRTPIAGGIRSRESGRAGARPL